MHGSNGDHKKIHAPVSQSVCGLPNLSLILTVSDRHTLKMVRWLSAFIVVLIVTATARGEELEPTPKLEIGTLQIPPEPAPTPSPVAQRNGTFWRNLRELRQGEWRTINTQGSPARRHEACYVRAPNGKHYLIGGRRIQPVSIFDPSTSTWTSAPGPGVEIHHMQCVVSDDGLVWMPSSWTGRFPREQNHADIFMYNTNTGEWGTRRGLPEERRRGGAAAVMADGKIYVTHGNRGGHGRHSTSLGWADVYDIAKDEWKSLPDAPNPRDHTGGALVNGEICVAGGRRGDSNDPPTNPVVMTDCYNLGDGRWYERGMMPQGRAGSAYGTTCDGVLVVAGGEGFGKAFDDVHFFDGIKWRNGPKLVRARHGTGVAVHGCGCGLLSVASGSGNQGGGPELRSMETLFPIGRTELCV